MTSAKTTVGAPVGAADWDEQRLDERYANLHGVTAGYLPKQRQALEDWFESLRAAVQQDKVPADKWPLSVRNLQKVINETPGLKNKVTAMIQEVPPDHRHGIEEIDDLLRALAHIITHTVAFDWNPGKRNFFPMSSLFVYMMYTKVGWDVFREKAFNDALRDVLKAWYAYLDSPDSATYLNDSLPNGWLSEPAVELLKLYEFEVDPAPQTFNAFFHRQIKRQFRPVDQPGNPQVVVSANDGTVIRWAQVKTSSADFRLKGQPYSLTSMLSDPSDKTWRPQQYVERFVGGHVFQTFLSGANYHRWWAPITGTVIEAPRVVPGLMFSELPNAGWDPTAGTYSQGYEASVNTRGLLFIESDHKTDGQKMLVCLMPIGITEISSVAFVKANGEPVKKGDRVEKGTELGRFSYGGSSMCLLFSKGVIDHFVTPPNTGATMDDGPPVFVGMQIAVTRALSKP